MAITVTKAAQMADGARWFCYLDPITYAFKALVPQQFFGSGGTFDVGAGKQLLAGPTPPCGPHVPHGVPCGGSVMPERRVAHHSTKNSAADFIAG